MATDEMGYLETVTRIVREARDELQRDNDEAERREREWMIEMVARHAKSLQDWRDYETRKRNMRLGLPEDFGISYDDDRR